MPLNCSLWATGNTATLEVPCGRATGLPSTLTPLLPLGRVISRMVGVITTVPDRIDAEMRLAGALNQELGLLAAGRGVVRNFDCRCGRIQLAGAGDGEILDVGFAGCKRGLERRACR